MQEKGLASILLRCCSAKAGVSKGTPAILPRSLPVGGATHVHAVQPLSNAISIHAPRGGSDFPGWYHPLRSGYFNPRSPWGERPETIQRDTGQWQFQSTLTVGGATRPAPALHPGPAISIHAPRGGSDLRRFGDNLVVHVFQSTLPVGGATASCLARIVRQAISIHAPRGGSDITDIWPGAGQ